MKKTLTVIIVLLGATSAFAQNNVTLTFTCQTTDGGYLQPDSITIENLTRNWSETLYYPDTVYILNVGTSVPNRLNDNGMQMMPNPFDGTTRVNVQSPKTENVKMTLTDMGGRVCAKFSGQLQEGGNLFTIALTTPQTYLLSVQTSSGIHSLKMENTGRAGANRIAYEGATGNNMPMVQLKSSSSHPFELGDEMRYRGYASSRVCFEVVKNQSTNDQVELIFDMHGTACSDMPTLQDNDGNIYNTVQIGNQCWMKENLRSEHYADGTEIPFGGDLGYENESYNHSDDFPFYYNNLEVSTSLCGYLYNWASVMRGGLSSNANPSGIQGVCPNGWHVPSTSEWEQLTAFVSSQSQYVCEEQSEWIAKALSSISSGWTQWCCDPLTSDDCDNCSPGQDVASNDAAGFSAYPAGATDGIGSYEANAISLYCDVPVASFWSSTQASSNTANKWDIYGIISIMFNVPDQEKVNALSVRCVKN